MPKMCLRQPGRTYSACGPFTTNKEKVQNFKETGESRYSYENKLDKACFQHGMAPGHFEILPRRTASDKVLRDRASNIAENPEYDVCQRGIASMVYDFFDKKSASGGDVKIEIMNPCLYILFLGDKSIT